MTALHTPTHTTDTPSSPESPAAQKRKMPAKKRNTQRVPKKKGKEKENKKRNKEGGDEEGGVPVFAESNDSLPAALTPRVGGGGVESWAAATNRWRREGRCAEVDDFRETVRMECLQKGLSRKDARAHAWSAAIAAFPPLGGTQQPVEIPLPDDPAATSAAAADDADATPRGLYDLPASWPALPANASLAADIAWVQSNRLAVVEERPGSGPTRVHLDRAHEPAPSRAALGWLETSVRSYAKYVDVAARAASAQVDEQEGVRRERMAIDAIRALLDEMSEGEGV